LNKPFSPTPTGEQEERLGGKLVTSPRDLTTSKYDLRWPAIIFMVFPVLVKNTCSASYRGLVTGVVCSKAADTGFGPGIAERVTAATRAGSRRSSGGAGVPSKGTVPVRAAANAAVNKANAIVNA
jgi:hypothetical protein